MAENNTREAKFTELLTIDLDKSKDFSLLYQGAEAVFPLRFFFLIANRMHDSSIFQLLFVTK